MNLPDMSNRNVEIYGVQVETKRQSGSSFSESILNEISSGLKKRSGGGQIDDATRRYVKKQLSSLLDEKIAQLRSAKESEKSSDSRKSMLRGNALNTSMSSK